MHVCPSLESPKVKNVSVTTQIDRNKLTQWPRIKAGNDFYIAEPCGNQFKQRNPEVPVAAYSVNKTKTSTPVKLVGTEKKTILFSFPFLDF